MPIFDLFSKRQRRARGDVPEVYTYDTIPQPLRAQIVHILRDLTAPKSGHEHLVKLLWNRIHDALCREYGVFVLSNKAEGSYADYEGACYDFVLGHKAAEQVLDLIELTLAYFDRYEYRGYLNGHAPSAIAELNARFQEHGLGYQYTDGQLVRVDSQFTHAEIVKPALALLSDPAFAGADEEFRSAHEHYRHGRFKECLVDCLRALESTIKTIGVERGWPIGQTDTAKRLIELCFTEELVPAALQSEFAALRSSLESGVPTVRNRMAGHGQGPSPIPVPPYVAGYLLHLTATVILLLVQAHRAPGAAT